MAKNKVSRFIRALAGGFMNVGRKIGARRFLFVWSAISVAIALVYGVAETASLYMSNYVLDMDIFVLTQILSTLFMFFRVFVPMFVLVLAAKYIFDFDGRHAGRASETFRLSVAAAVFFGLAIAAFYYLNAGHIIGQGTGGRLCPAGAVCWFNWPMAMLAGKVFLSSTVGFTLLFLGLRGIYNELSYILSRK